MWLRTWLSIVLVIALTPVAFALLPVLVAIAMLGAFFAEWKGMRHA